MNIEELSGVYDGSKSTFALLEACGWGPLVNLGYFSAPMLPAMMIGGLAPFQQRLAHESLALLRAGDGDRVLDACCGRGYTTARIAEAGADVLGLDLLEEHVRIARAWYGTGPTLRFGVGDVTDLPEKSEGFPLDDDSVDRVLCLEAAFHFSAQGRRDFLSESLRILRPGGRLVLVDFTWKNDDPGSIEELDPKRIVRDTWGFDEFEPFDRYRATARELGLREVQVCDWSDMVMARFERLAQLFTRVGMFPPARRVLSVFRPALGRVDPAAWRAAHEATQVHGRVASMSKYVAFVFQKPRRRTSRF
jgi:SAM-dependent methyltransferase